MQLSLFGYHSFINISRPPGPNRGVINILSKPVVLLPSQGLNDAERNYCVYEKELLAIKAAFEEWRHYLEGAPHQITVFSDHKGLEFFADAKVINQRHARWATFFKRFDFVVKYLPGSSNPRADALSRRPDYEPPETNTPQLTQQHILDPTIVEVAAISRPANLCLPRSCEASPRS